MKNIVLLCVVVVLFLGTNLYAADGDLFVTGNVGIGTTSPTAQLSIVSPVTWTPLSVTVTVQAGSYTVMSEGNISFQTELFSGDSVKFNDETAVYTVYAVGGNSFVLASAYAGNYTSGVTVYRLVKPASFTISDALNNNYLTVTRSGNVGIGTIAPAAQLEVVGGLKASSVQTNSQVTKGPIIFGSTQPGTTRTNKGLCWTSTGKIGYCSSAINSSGTCTCNQIN